MSKYQESGVDIATANSLVENIKHLTDHTKNPGVVSEIGGFGAVFDLLATGEYRHPLLVSSTDGVGTKLLVAQAAGNHRFVGVDLVAMCANDVLAQGARPLFFLDYFATGVLENEVALQVIEGISEGCKQANMSLVGGETAEMPGMYTKGHYDLAGFAVGVVEKSEILPKLDAMTAGDVIVGLASSGLHSNGFSLVRRVLQDMQISYDSTCPLVHDGRSWADVLLTPTRIYTRSVLEVLPLIKGMAHITGGGLIHNIPRILPKHLAAHISQDSWTRQEIFTWLEDKAEIPTIDMLETFNCGIGMALVTASSNVDTLISLLGASGEKSSIIGKIIPRSEHAVTIDYSLRP
ncbi:phosphoribosylformylglycinamidine cyclo-ligase [Anaplasma platys]|uniref:Phosphoribosylformylglycinamidine cyclo-ligase n=1 Tax=Anaplasma platys TaxID=949 RepID=A0A858PXJ6_9RICK|nr:phosphoribosylformylglycinamidine cyclo-ligase [Anaplasma platys]QJC27299.1 phosphoribosylformylglycinamidine cyclo-ligase [Anaplasma platys]